MRFRDYALATCRALFRRDEVAGEIRDEMLFHLQMRTGEYQRQGLTAQEAYRAASKRFGNLAVMQDRGYDVRGGGAAETIVQDVRYSARLLRRQPAFTLVSIALMALAIGATTTLFSVAYGVLLEPLPWKDAVRLVRLHEVRKNAGPGEEPGLTNLSLLAWRERPRAIVALGAWTRTFNRVLSVGGERRLVPMTSVTPSLMPLLGVAALTGSGFQDADGKRDSPPVVILSHALWQDAFGGRPDVIGRTLDIDGRETRVVGVMPRSFTFPDGETRGWTPTSVEPVVVGRYGRHKMFFQAIARLAPGATADEAAAEGTVRVQHADPAARAAFTDAERPSGIVATPMFDADTRGVRLPILLALSAVGLLLLTATANTAGVQLVRTAARRREVAIRATLGAGTARIARQLVVESVLLGAAGGVLGLVVAVWLCHLLPVVLPPAFPRLADIAINIPALLFALATSIASSIAIGAIPALFARRVNLVEALTDRRPSLARRLARTHSRTRAALVAAQVAIASLLLVGAALLTRSFLRLMATDLGYDGSRVLSAQVHFPDTLGATGQQIVLDGLMARLRAHPAVVEPAFALRMPLEGQELPQPARVLDGAATWREVTVPSRLVSVDYFSTLRIGLHAGRAFRPSDVTARADVAVVNRSFATRYLGAAPIGRRVLAGHRDAEIVGVVEDVRQRHVAESPEPALYVLYRQPPGGRLVLSAATLFVRTKGNSLALAPHLRALVRQADRALIVDRVQTLEQARSDDLRQPRLYSTLLGGLALVAAVIAGVGLFAVLAYLVAMRRPEFGVRSALGACPGDIVRLVLREGLAITVAGITVGVGSALLLVRSLASFVYGISVYDAVSLGAVPLAVLIVSALACLAPAWRAARTDPMEALRQ